MAYTWRQGDLFYILKLIFKTFANITFLKDLFLFENYVSICLHKGGLVCAGADPCTVQKRPSDPPELKLQVSEPPNLDAGD